MGCEMMEFSEGDDIDGSDEEESNQEEKSLP